MVVEKLTRFQLNLRVIMYDEGESSQKIQELANQLEQIVNLVKGKINSAIKSSYSEQKKNL